MIAAGQGKLDAVRELLDAKADVNLQDKYGQSAYVRGTCLVCYFRS